MEDLKVELYCHLSDDRLIENLDANLKLDIAVVRANMFKGSKASVCGGGPSFKETMHELTGDIWACNGTYDWLQDQGIIADYFFGWDPGIELLDFLKRPHKKTIFVIASTCHPEVFAALKDHEVFMFHADTGSTPVTHEAMIRHKRKGEFYVGGGSACLTRAPYLLYMMGYKEVHLFGMDSSLRDNGESHVGHSGGIGPGVNKIYFAEREFLAPLWMAAQAQQFLPMTEALKEMKIIVHGDGLIPHIARMNNFHYDNQAVEAA